MNSVKYLLLFTLFLAHSNYAHIIYSKVPPECKVVESFTLFSKSKSEKHRIKELVRGIDFKFDAVVFSERLYKSQKAIENDRFNKWLASKDPDLIVEPNFVGVPKGAKEFKGVLLSCGN